MCGSHAINVFMCTNHRFCAVAAHSFGFGGPGHLKEPVVICVVYSRNVPAVLRLQTSTYAVNLANKLEIETLYYIFIFRQKKN